MTFQELHCFAAHESFKANTGRSKSLGMVVGGHPCYHGDGVVVGGGLSVLFVLIIVLMFGISVVVIIVLIIVLVLFILLLFFLVLVLVLVLLLLLVLVLVLALMIRLGLHVLPTHWNALHYGVDFDLCVILAPSCTTQPEHA